MCEGVLGDLQQPIVNLGAGDGLVVREALEGGDDEVVILDGGAAFDFLEHAAALAHAAEFGVNLLIGDFDGGRLDLEVLVVLDLQFGFEIEDRAELERLFKVGLLGDDFRAGLPA